MLLNHKQQRHFTLALLLGTGKPVSAEKIRRELDCSGPTLTRTLKEIRDTYSAEIKYSKSSHSYQLSDKGSLNAKVLRRMRDELTEHITLKNQGNEPTNAITLDKEKKRVVSLSLRLSVLRKIDTTVNLQELTRSDVVEYLVENYIDDLLMRMNQAKIKR
ncbi:tellurium resistance protein TerW [Enterobacillus tribolii]|uniref:Tellurium resistance protein TerW n=1 Tax=Enterobacillus tribolii TaxID=1487935 RepID=A0A370R2N8_9GAMM|nr:tellurium resistance protein TerW [Enterobacillus tribolii]MBW7983090.1 tellurium resistance protein TerW [Enterobacillus tribolii]RDK95806.1 hypothetical protein C8D90_102289 [Enterobacillus tribolii]